MYRWYVCTATTQLRVILEKEVGALGGEPQTVEFDILLFDSIQRISVKSNVWHQFGTQERGGVGVRGKGRQKP